MNYKDFEQNISEIILGRGRDYFEDGAVEDLTKEDGHWLANVQGSEMYEVAIKGIRSIKEWDCDCPYDGGPVCKHVVAVLYAVQAENAKTKSSKSKKAKNQVDVIFQNAKSEELLAFFKKKLRYHKDLKHELVTEFIDLLDVGDKERFNKIVDNLIKKAGNRYGFIDYRASRRLSRDFNALLGQAEKAIDKKNYVDALDICAAVIRKVPKLFSTVDDSSGELQGSCYYALSILEKLLEAPVAPMFKDQIFDFMLHAFENDKTDFDLKDDMLLAFLEKDWEDDKLIRIKEVVQKVFDKLEDDDYGLEFYISILIGIAHRIGDESEAEKLMSQYTHFPGVRKMKLEILLEKEDYESAKLLVAEGIKVAEEKSHRGTVSSWNDVLIEISRLEKNIEEERRLLRDTFFKEYRRMGYFIQLKKTFDSTEWLEERETIITQILGKEKAPNHNNIDTLAQIYVEEKLWKRLLELLQIEEVSIYSIDRYGSHLNEMYPEEMLALYKPLVLNEARNANGRPQYRQVVGRLEDLLEIKGGRELVIELVQKLRVDYANRPAMLDELTKI